MNNGAAILRRRRRMRGTPPEPSAPSIISVSISGDPGIGQTLTAVVSRTGYPTPTLSYVWKNAGTPIGGETGATYVPVAGDVGDNITVTVTATNSEGSDSDTSAAVTILAAPVAAGGLSDQTYTQDAAVTPLDVSADFTGSSITYALAPGSAALPAGLSLSSAGLLSGTPTALADGLSIVVRGTNISGYDDSAFSLTVANVPDQMTAPTVTASGATSISVDRAAAPDDNNSTITQYDLRWQEDGGSWTTVTDISDPETVSSLTASTLYYVQTRAVNVIGNGAWSASDSATTSDAATAPAQMSAPTFSDVLYETATVVRGSAPADGGSSITGYKMRWRPTSGGAWTTVDPFGATADLTGLDDDTEYEAQQLATNAEGDGSWSNSGTFTTDQLPDIEGNEDGTVDITVDDGTFSVTISGATHAHHNGTFGPFDPDDFTGGAIKMANPVIAGTAGTDVEITSARGLWLYPDDDVPTITGQWRRDTVDISGETGSTYTTTATDEGTDVDYEETATNSAGSRSGDSNDISIPVSGVWDVEVVENFIRINDAPAVIAPTSEVVGNKIRITA